MRGPCLSIGLRRWPSLWNYEILINLCYRSSLRSGRRVMKMGTPSPLWRIKIVMACTQTINPLCRSGPMFNPFDQLIEISEHNMTKINVIYSHLWTVSNKITRAIAIVFAIFLWFHWQILSPHACYKQHETKKIMAW